MKKNTVEHICFVGLGYVGLPTAALLASKGVNVHGVDVNPRAVEAVNKGSAHIEEADLEELIAGAVKAGTLRADTVPAKADIFVIAVPTPFNEDKTPDLSYVLAAGRSVAPYLEKGNLVILESTSPVGATEELREAILAERADLSGDGDLLFAYCPERILPGRTVYELVHNSRSIGGMTPEAAEYARDMYQLFCTAELVLTDARTAEMTKLTENSFRDVNIAFANELAIICDKQGINVHEVAALANRHPRVNILSPGTGVGGHCIPVDPWFIVAGNPEEAKLIKQARLTNDYKPLYTAETVIAAAKERGLKKCAILGLTYKPDVDDFRESPAFAVLEGLAESGLDITVHDPYLDKLHKALPEGVKTAENAAALLSSGDTVVLLNTPHSCYAELKNGISACLIDPAGFFNAA